MNSGILYHGHMSIRFVNCRVRGHGIWKSDSVNLGVSIWSERKTIRSTIIWPTNGDLIRSEDGAGGQSMGRRLNYLGSHWREKLHTHTAAHVHLLLGIPPCFWHSTIVGSFWFIIFSFQFFFFACAYQPSSITNLNWYSTFLTWTKDL